MALLGWAWTAGRIARGNRRRQAQARAGEDAAERLLQTQGYAVLDRQVTVRFTMELDGVEVWVHNRADLVVERAGRVFVADVKTGDRVTDPTWPATRRQLLEYWLSHEVDGVLLVDMDAGRVVEVGFPSLVASE